MEVFLAFQLMQGRPPLTITSHIFGADTNDSYVAIDWVIELFTANLPHLLLI